MQATAKLRVIARHLWSALARPFDRPHLTAMRNDNFDQGYIDKLEWIERAWQPALDDIIQPYIDLNREPSDAVLEAFGSILGASQNEVRKLIARRAQASGSTLLNQWV